MHNYNQVNPSQTLNPAHTKIDNYNDYYKDNNMSVHTSGRHRQFILSANVSTALNFRACDSSIDWFWLGVNDFIVHQLKNGSDSNDVVFLCLYCYSCGVNSAIL